VTTTTAKKKPTPVVVVREPGSLSRDVFVGVLIGVLTLELVRRLHSGR